MAEIEAGKEVPDHLSTPSPQTTLRLKLIDDASGKYFVGQLLSPIRKQAAIAVKWNVQRG